MLLLVFGCNSINHTEFFFIKTKFSCITLVKSFQNTGEKQRKKKQNLYLATQRSSRTAVHGKSYFNIFMEIYVSVRCVYTNGHIRFFISIERSSLLLGKNYVMGALSLLCAYLYVSTLFLSIYIRTLVIYLYIAHTLCCVFTANVFCSSSAYNSPSKLSTAFKYINIAWRFIILNEGDDEKTL